MEGDEIYTRNREISSAVMFRKVMLHYSMSAAEERGLTRSFLPITCGLAHP
jgi:hypothetical protein